MSRFWILIFYWWGVGFNSVRFSLFVLVWTPTCLELRHPLLFAITQLKLTVSPLPHTPPPAPSLSHLFPCRFGSNSTCEWCLALIVTSLLHQLRDVCNTRQWILANNFSESLSGIVGNVIVSLKACSVGAQFQINAISAVCKCYVSQVCLPLPGVSNAVGCGCVCLTVAGYEDVGQASGSGDFCKGGYGTAVAAAASAQSKPASSVTGPGVGECRHMPN